MWKKIIRKKKIWTSILFILIKSKIQSTSDKQNRLDQERILISSFWWLYSEVTIQKLKQIEKCKNKKKKNLRDNSMLLHVWEEEETTVKTRKCEEVEALRKWGAADRDDDSERIFAGSAMTVTYKYMQLSASLRRNCRASFYIEKRLNNKQIHASLFWNILGT